jgi:Mrp family chromosome partitioning ATPase/capsular polysaccharide biosynthesis protein
MSGPDAPSSDEVKLPFDPRTVVAGFFQHKLLLAFLVLVAAGAGVAAGWYLGRRTYQAETMLRYMVMGATPEIAATRLQTEMNQVKIPKNIAETRQRLSLPTTLEKLGASIEVRVERNSSLLYIRATWDSADTAAAIANTLRDVYLEEWIQVQSAELDRLFTRAGSELKALDSQAERLAGVIEDIRKKQADEVAEAEKTGKVNVPFRYQQLREAIAADQMRRANVAELASRELDLQRARTLRSKDLISPAEYEKTQSAYERQRAVTVDSGKIQAYRKELEQLSDVMAKQPGGASAQDTLLQTTLLKSIDLDLQRVGLSEKVHDLGQVRDQIREAMSRKTSLEAGAHGPVAPSPTAIMDFKSLRELIAQVRGQYGADASNFEVGANAQAAITPIKSTRKLLAIGVSGGVFVLGFLMILLVELFHRRIRSGREVDLRLGLPLLGALPHVTRGSDRRATQARADFVEAVRLIAERVRVKVPGRGARILITSSSAGEGRALVTSHLATAFGRRGEQVLVVDAEVREPRRVTGLVSLDPGMSSAVLGLGDLLCGNAKDVKTVIVPSGIPKVALLPRGRAVDAPEPLGSEEMGFLLTEAARQATVVVILAPPVLPNVDTGYLAHWCDAILLVVRAGKVPVGTIRRAVKRLSDYSVQVAGVILNEVQRPFAERD